MLEKLRKLLPPILVECTLDEPKDTAPLAERADKLVAIVDKGLVVLEHHYAIMDWVSKQPTVPGDCWNDTAVCAHMAAYLGMNPVVFGFITNRGAEHLECATEEGYGYRFWNVYPYNRVAPFTFTLSPVMTVSEWEYFWSQHLRCNVHAIGPYDAVNGHYVQDVLIDEIHYGNMELVELVDVDRAMVYFKSGDYDLVYLP